MTTYKREIFMGGSYAMCEVIRSTRPNNTDTLTKDDYLLCMSPDNKYIFIAHQSMGTWCVMDEYDIFHDLTILLEQVRDGK